MPQRKNEGPFWASKMPQVLQPRRLHGPCSDSNAKLASTTALTNQLDLEGQCPQAPVSQTFDSSVLKANDEGKGPVKVKAGGKVYLVVPCHASEEESQNQLFWVNSEMDSSVEQTKSLFSAKSPHLSVDNNSDHLAPVEQVLEVSSKLSQQMNRCRVSSYGECSNCEDDKDQGTDVIRDPKPGRFRYMTKM